MSVQTQIDRIKDNITSAFNAVGNKGGTVPTSKNSDNLETAINSIPTDVTLPELNNPGYAEDLLYGKQLIDADGKIVNGTMDFITPENTSFYLPATNIEEYEDAYGKRAMMSIRLPNRLAFEAGSTARMQSNLTNFGDAVASDVTKGKTFTSANGYMVTGTKEDTIVAVEQATPSISVDSYGKVTATATQEAGYVEAGTKTAEKQLNVATYAKYTPTENDYYIPITNKYVVGNQIIKGDANLVPNNIKKGVSIFDVVGTYEGSGGGSGVISAVATGTYTPASDISTSIEIEHGLGVTPNFCIWMAENDFSDITDVSAAVVGAMVAKPMLHSASSGITYPYQYFLRGYNVSGLSNGTASYKSEGCMTDTIVTILGNNTYKLKSGWTYRWVAGVINA